LQAKGALRSLIEKSVQFRRGPAAVTRSKLQMPLVVILGRWSELWIGVRRTAL